MLYIYAPLPAIDPLTGLPVRNAEGQVYAVDDETFSTPLAITDLNGLAMSSVKVGSQGVTEAFRVEDRPEVLWKSGNYVLHLWPPRALVDSSAASATAASAAQAAAEEAAGDAKDAAASFTAASLPVGGLSGQVLTKLSGTDRDAGWQTPAVGGGSSKGYLVLTDVDEIPAGTLAGTLIARVATAIQEATKINVLSGSGNATSAGLANGANGVTVPIPANVAVGDVLLAIIASQGGAGGSFTAPSGWKVDYSSTEGRRIAVAHYSVTSQAALSALGSSARFDPPAEAVSNRLVGIVNRVTGADPSTPILTVGEYSYGTVNDLTTKAFSASASAGAVVALATTNNSGGTAAPAVSFAGLTQFGAYDFNAGTADSQTGIFASWSAATGTSIGEQKATVNPSSTGQVVGFAFAMKERG